MDEDWLSDCFRKKNARQKIAVHVTRHHVLNLTSASLARWRRGVWEGNVLIMINSCKHADREKLCAIIMGSAFTTAASSPDISRRVAIGMHINIMMSKPPNPGQYGWKGCGMVQREIRRLPRKCCPPAIRVSRQNIIIQIQVQLEGMVSQMGLAKQIFSAFEWP